MVTPPCWPWLNGHLSETTGTLLDCWRTKHPLERSYTRYSTAYRTSQSRIDFFLASPLTLSVFPLLSSEIECWNKTTHHHQVHLIMRSRELPTHSETPPKPDLLKKLNSQDAQALKNKLEPLNTWCAEHLSLLPNMSPDIVIQYTDTLIHQLTSAYYSFTNPSPHKPSKLEHTFAQLVNSLPPPDDPNFLHKISQLHDTYSQWRKQISKNNTTKLHRALVRGS